MGFSLINSGWEWRYSNFIMEKKKKTTDQLFAEVYNNPKYSQKHLVIVGGKVHVAKTGVGVSQLLKTLMKKYPQDTPLVAYVPGRETLILISNSP